MSGIFSAASFKAQFKAAVDARVWLCLSSIHLFSYLSLFIPPDNSLGSSSEWFECLLAGFTLTSSYVFLPPSTSLDCGGRPGEDGGVSLPAGGGGGGAAGEPPRRLPAVLRRETGTLAGETDTLISSRNTSSSQRVANSALKAVCLHVKWTNWSHVQAPGTWTWTCLTPAFVSFIFFSLSLDRGAAAAARR